MKVLEVPSFQLVLVSLVAAIEPDCQALIDANTQTLGLVRTIQVNCTIASTGGGRKQVTELWWAREGARERIRRVGGHIEPTADGRPRDIEDILIDGPVYKWLQNWDPKNPQKITPTEQGTVSAATGPQTNVSGVNIAPSHQLLFEVEDRPRRTLAELARVSPKVTCKGKVELEGRELRLISLEYPEEDAIYQMGKRHIDVYLDPAAGYMIRKIVVDVAGKIVSDGPPRSFVHAHEVLEFKDFGGGIFVPIKIRHTAPKLLSETVVKSIKINEPIPPETFELHWPKYAAIKHYPPVNGRFKIELWGDDEPVAEIKKVQDFDVVEAELRKDPRVAAELGPLPGAPLPPPRSMMIKLSLALGALVAIMIGLVLYRRIREQAAA